MTTARRTARSAFLACATSLALAPALVGSAPAAPAIAMHGEPRYPADAGHFGYVDPNAPKGGSLVLGNVGSFDSLNPFIVRGVPAEGRRHTHQSLLARAYDEPFSLYGLIADDVETPPDRAWVRFRIREGARFHDGSEITVDDVVFSLETLRDQGRPNHRYYYGQVAETRRDGPRSVTMVFKDTSNRELPLIMGLMPILSKADLTANEFDRVSLRPLMGSGPYVVEHVDAGRSIRYRRMADHWSQDLMSQKGQHNFDTVRYDYYRDDAAMLEAFKAGKVDLREETDPGRWAQAYQGPGLEAGHYVLAEFGHGRPAGMFGMALNTRRPQFRDRRVRAAIAYAFDFEWVNRTLYHGAYHRSRSFFENSELAATGLPSPAEMALLEPFRDQLPDEVFTREYNPPASDGSGRLRRNLRQARALLEAAGWDIQDLKLVPKGGGEPFRFELLLLRRSNEKLAQHLALNLEKLGIEMSIRLVDTSQYQQRTATYDFDAMFYLWDPSLSPGNEQAFYWGSDAATREGTRNYPGIRVPAIDTLIGRISDAPDRESLVAAVRAMDRVLQWGHYVVPLFHLKTDRVAYWRRFGMPAEPPLYGFRLETWWHDAAKAANLPNR